MPIIPRLALLALTFCQPLLLRRLLDYLKHSDVESKNIGYGLIGAYFVVYVGLAVSAVHNIIICVLPTNTPFRLHRLSTGIDITDFYPCFAARS